MLVDVILGIIMVLCLIVICWEVSLRLRAQRVYIVTVGSIPLGFDLCLLISFNGQNQPNLIKEI